MRGLATNQISTQSDNQVMRYDNFQYPMCKLGVVGAAGEILFVGSPPNYIGTQWYLLQDRFY